MAKAMRPRMPTLAQLTGERPRCQYCGKDVKPRNERVEVLGHLAVPPSLEELRTMQQPEPSYPSIDLAAQAGLRTEVRVPLCAGTSVFQSQKAYTAIHFWTGTYDAWGHQDARWLFCCMECGLSFGIAAYRAGYRMKGRTDA